MNGGAVRWGLCAGVVAAAHALALFALTAPNPRVDSDAGSPVVTLELSPVSAAPAPDEPQPEAQPDAEPAPAAQAAAAQPDAQPPVPKPAPIDQRPPPPPAMPSADAETPPLPPPDPPPPAPVPTPDLAAAPPPPPTPAPEKETLSPPPPPPPTPEKETPPVVDTAPQAPSAPMSAPAVTALATADDAASSSLAPGREEEVSPAAIRTWRQELIAQIERHKWFPAGARGHSGVALVAFSIDREGRLMEARIAGSSGSGALDEAALDLIRRSQPFPTPPAALREKDLSFVAPVRYLAPASSR